MTDNAANKKSGQELFLSPAGMQWWRDAKFGMFIHWGVYAIPGRGEWLMWNERIPFSEYRKLADQFKPQKFDARAWAAAAKSAGMKYMVLTTKHHDGFCLFDSQVSDFTSVKTAARRDFIAEYVTACRDAGLGVGFYYSPLDWRFPGYFFPDLYNESFEALKQQTYDQVRELMTNYGKIDVLWYDGGEDGWLGFGGIEWGANGWHNREPNYLKEKVYSGLPYWEGEKLTAMVRQLQPGIMINNRSAWEGDFDTPENRIGAFNTRRAWETCDTLSGSWGWMPDRPIRSLRSVIQLLVRVATGDGNLLLNTGPTAEGEIEARQVRRLAEVGQWLEQYGQSLYATRGGPFPSQAWGGFTHRDNHLYIHILDWPEDYVALPPLEQSIANIRSLTAASVKVETVAGETRISVPPSDRQAIDTIIAVELDRAIQA